MRTLNLKPEHKAIREYYSQLNTLTRNLNARTEGSVAPVFAALLRHCAGQVGKTLIEQYSIKRPNQSLRVDGAVVDEFKLAHGYWEAKDTADDLDVEIKKKVEKGYPKDNILFQAPERAMLYQDGNLVLDADITQPENLIDILELFFGYEPPAFDQWEQAVNEFKLKVPELGEGLLKLIEEQRRGNPEFVRAFEGFTQVVQESINPNISTQAVEEMLIQHILTERIFRTIFDNPDFVTRNVIAREIEKVVQALTSRSFSRNAFLGSLDRFYGAIEQTAATIDDYSQKQAFLNTVYEKFFQGFSIKAADIYGIVYTPQPIVNFMVSSVEHILKEEFGRTLSDENVHIIDPFVGTGNFIINIMRRIQKTKLTQKYTDELHCNEVMLLPYYIASMNIEHAYYELTGTYKPYEGICLVDTFEVTEQMSIFGHENTERIAKQRSAPIFVVIANPPYNAKQVNENDNNKKRVYPYVDKQVADTYVKYSKAQNNNALSDVYVKAIKWASDRIKGEGIVAYITNNSFVDGFAFDGMREHLENDFDSIYIFDLGGNVRKNPKLSGTTNNVFGIQVGVCINLFIRKQKKGSRKAKIHYARLDEYWTKEQKYDELDNKENKQNIDWTVIHPDTKHTWLTEGLEKEYVSFIELSSKKLVSESPRIFNTFCCGIQTNKDAWLYNWDKNSLDININKFINFYNSEVDRWINRTNKQVKIDNFIDLDDTKAKWSSDLFELVAQGKKLGFDGQKHRIVLYRPFCKMDLYFDDLLIHRPALWPDLFSQTESKNLIISIKSIGMNQPFHALITDVIPDVQLTPNGQSFPFYIYSNGGANRTENITDWALAEFQKQYKDTSITKWDIFHYVYGYLHHPGYRAKYAANLRRELPRLPFAPDFWAFSKVGKRLAEIHVHYEDQPEYPLAQVEKPGKPLDWRVEKMKLSPDKTALIYNDFLTLTGIPVEVYNYKLGNRSALEWIVDQYRVKTDPRSGITNDPNNPEDPEYIVRLVKKIITVSLETVQIVSGLSEKFE